MGLAQPISTADAAVAAAEPPNWLQIIFFSGGPLGIGIMWLLLALSITAAYLIFDHLLSLRQKELIPAELPPRIHQLLVGGRVAEAQELAAVSHRHCWASSWRPRSLRPREVGPPWRRDWKMRPPISRRD